MTKFTKLMLTLALLLVGVVGAKADWVEDYSIDYSTTSNFPFYVMGYVPEWVDGVMTDYGAMYEYKKTTELAGTENVVGTVMAGSTEYSKVQLESAGWHQYFIADGIPTSIGGNYTVKAMVKASEAVNINVNIGWGWGEGKSKGTTVAIGTEWAEVEWEYTEVGGTSCNLVAQPGTTTATIEWKYVKVCHEISTELQDRPEPAEPAAPQWGTSIKVVDYSTQNNYPYYRMDAPEGFSFDVENGKFLINNPTVATNFWDVQPFIIDGANMKEGYEYVVRIKMNTTGAGSARVVLGTWSKDYYKDFDFADAYAYYDIDLGVATFSSTNDVHALLQCGNFFGKIAIDKVEVFEVLPKQGLSDAIDLAKLQPRFAKTTASWNALQEAITAGETALAEANTLASVQDATDAIDDAVAGLTFLPGYSNLTANKFKHYASLNEPGEGETVGCAYETFTACDLPFGDGTVSELNWADLAGYDNLIVLTQGSIKPRFCINRIEAGGNQAATQAESKMIDINDNNGNTWSATKYQTIESNVYTIDLQEIVNDWGFARLHSIKKQGWGDGVTVTGMYLYRNMSYGIIGELTGGFDAADVDMTPTATEGEYTLTVNNFVVDDVKAYNYKLRANNVWNDYDLPAGNENNTWTPTEGIGLYTLTFTANVLNHTLTCVGEKSADFTYVVVGSEKKNDENIDSPLFDGNWNTATSTDVLTKGGDGNYTLKKEVTLEAQHAQFKVVAKNGDDVVKWFGNGVGSNDASYDFAEDGTYFVTFTFNGSTVSASADLKQYYTVVGGFNTEEGDQDDVIFGKTWKADLVANDMIHQDDGTYKKTFTKVALEAGTIKYKVVKDHSWTVNYGDKNNSNNNLSFGVNEAGTYDITFTFNPSETTASCALSIYKSITDAGYATYCSSYDLDFEDTGLTAYIAKLNGTEVSFEEVTSAPHDTGLLLKADEGEYTIPLKQSDTNTTGNVLIGVNSETVVNKSGIFVLMASPKVGFYKTTAASFTVGAHTAYIDAIAGARSFISLDGDNEVTGVENLTPALSEGEGAVYDLQGRRVAQPTKGLYIVNGKKVFVNK